MTTVIDYILIALISVIFANCDILKKIYWAVFPFQDFCCWSTAITGLHLINQYSHFNLNFFWMASAACLCLVSANRRYTKIIENHTSTCNTSQIKKKLWHPLLFWHNCRKCVLVTEDLYRCSNNILHITKKGNISLVSHEKELTFWRTVFHTNSTLSLWHDERYLCWEMTTKSHDILYWWITTFCFKISVLLH